MKQIAKRVLGYGETRRNFKARSRPWLNYGVTVLAVGLALLLHSVLVPLFGGDLDSSPFIMFFAAVIVAAWLGGLWPGLLATALSAGLGSYFFLFPQDSLQVATPAQGLRLALFALGGALISALVEMMHSARRRAEANALEVKKSEDQLKESEERYRTFIEQSTEGIWRFELEEPVSPDLPEGEQIEHFYRHAYLAEANDAMAAMYGYERAEEIVGARLEDLLPRSHPANVAYLEAFVRSGYTLTDVESHEVDREGNAKYFLNNLTGIVENGLLVRAWGTQRDVTERKRAEEERSRLAAIVESSDDAILGKTLDGTITSWNRAAERLYGYSVEEAVGQTVTMLVPPDRPEEVPEILQKVRRGEKVERLETVRVTRDGRHLDVSLTVSPIRNPEGEIVGASTIARDITERKRAEEALREARETERNRIARDLHDDILQDIVYALQEIQIVQIISEDGGATGLEEAAEALRRSVEGLRGAVFELRLRETLGRSFVSSLEGLLDLNRRMARRSYELELIVEDGFPRSLSERAGRELVRIVQEALANVRRHAEARHARVRLWREGDLARMEVADDGRGFDAESPRVGVGQQSMRHRALELGGELEVESRPGRGTRVRFEAPVSRLIEG
jgi:PAS domain S-box-containing protein